MGSMEHTWGTPAMNRFYQHTQVCAPPTPWGRVLLEKLTVPQLARNSSHFQEAESSLAHSQEPASCPYVEMHTTIHYTYHLY